MKLFRKQFLVLFVFLLTFPVLLNAEEVSEQEAAAVARQFLNQRGRQIGAQRALRIAVRGRRAPMANASGPTAGYMSDPTVSSDCDMKETRITAQSVWNDDWSK